MNEYIAKMGKPRATPKPRAGEHTKGPWRVGSEVDSAGHVVYINVETHAGKVSCVGVYGHKPNGKTAGQKYTDKFGDERHKPFISEAEARANAQRIVACVNACEGMSTESLEEGTQPRLENATMRGDLLASENKTLRERELELVEALSKTLSAWSFISEGDQPYQMRDAMKQTRAILAKARP